MCIPAHSSTVSMWNYQGILPSVQQIQGNMFGIFFPKNLKEKGENFIKQLLMQVSLIMLFSACYKKNTMVKSFENAGPGKLFILLN